MAALALHLYFNRCTYSYDVGRLQKLNSNAQSKCLSAIFWTLSRPYKKKVSFKMNRNEFLTQQREAWLVFISNGGDPSLTNSFFK
jgi:hypothetical protein